MDTRDQRHKRPAYGHLGATCLAVLAFGAGIRGLEWPVWSDSTFWLDGVPLLPSFDAYAWLAGAAGHGRMAGWPLAWLIDCLSETIGVAPGLVAFWLPLVLAPLPGVVVAIVCARRGFPEAGLAAGLLAGSGLGYLLRTRLGYADTELFALTLAVALAAVWGETVTRAGRDARASSHARLRGPHVLILGSAVLFWAWSQLYPGGFPVALAVLAAGVPAAWLATGSPGLGPVVLAATIVLCAGHFGWLGPLLTLALFSAWRVRPGLARALPATGLLGAIVAGTVWFQPEQWLRALQTVAAYAGTDLVVVPTADWPLPDAGAAVRESGRVGAAELLARAGTHWSIALAGIAGYAWAAARWPALLTFLPLALLGLAGPWLGNRFVMYAVPVTGLGLGLGTALLLERWRIAAPARWLCHGGLAAIVVAVSVGHALQFAARPAVARGHAAALLELRRDVAPDGRLWEWWDFGYAAGYFTGLPVLADGGSATRERAFALGRVFGAGEPRAAAGLMALASCARKRVEAGDAPEDWSDVYGARPLGALVGLSSSAAEARLDRLHRRDPWCDSMLPAEYLVVSWQTLRRAEWVSFFERWRLTAGARGHGQSEVIEPPVQLDRERGLLETRGGTVRLSSLDVLQADARHHRSWPRPNGWHAVVNNDIGEGVLLDDELYRTTAVQMLIAEPSRFDDHFELEVDAFPTARIYRVR